MGDPPIVNNTTKSTNDSNSNPVQSIKESPRNKIKKRLANKIEKARKEAELRHSNNSSLTNSPKKFKTPHLPNSNSNLDIQKQNTQATSPIKLLQNNLEQKLNELEASKENMRNTSCETDATTQYMDLPIRADQQKNLKLQKNNNNESPSKKNRKYRDVLGKPKMESSTLDLTETSVKSSPREYNVNSNLQNSNFESLSSPIKPDKSYSSVIQNHQIKNFDLPDESLGSLANSINIMNLTNKIRDSTQNTNNSNSNDEQSSARKQELSVYLKRLLKKEEEKILAGDYGTTERSSPTIRAGGDTDNEIRSDVKALMEQLEGKN